MGGIGIGYRRRRYPVAKGYFLPGLLAVPGRVLTPRTAALSNRILRLLPLPGPIDGIRRRRLHIEAEDGEKLALTVYEPEKDKPENPHGASSGENGGLPCLVYFHGGGFCIGDAGYIHRNGMDYARQASCKVVMVHYRTSDRFPFPTPFQDCCTGLRYVWEHSAELGIDRSRLAVGGDSAGGALAAACSLWARDEAEIRLCFQLLIYPVTDCRMETESMKKYTDSPLWNARLNRRMWEIYLRDIHLRDIRLHDIRLHDIRRQLDSEKISAYASPALARDFSGLPPAWIEVEQYDCLRDEGIAYGEALQRAGVAVEIKMRRGTFHGFDVFRGAAGTQQALRERGEALRRGFSLAGEQGEA